MICIWEKKLRNEFFSLLVGVIASSIQRQRLYWKKNGINSYYFPFHLSDETAVIFTLDSIEIKDITIRPPEIVDSCNVIFEFTGLSISTPVVPIKPTGSVDVDKFVDIEGTNVTFTFESLSISDPVKKLEGAALDTESATVTVAFDSLTINDPLKYGNTDTDGTTINITFDSLEIL